jgi:hypothetical protein
MPEEALILFDDVESLSTSPGVHLLDDWMGGSGCSKNPMIAFFVKNQAFEPLNPRHTDKKVRPLSFADWVPAMAG